jgi:hypothetical protein
VVPEVAFFHDKAVGTETEQRHPCQILGAAIGQPALRAPRHGGLITVDDRRTELALRRFFLREHAGQVTRFRILKGMLLPERAFGIKRADSGYVMPGPAALPYLCPPLGCLSCIHMPTIGKGTDKTARGQVRHRTAVGAGTRSLNAAYLKSRREPLAAAPTEARATVGTSAVSVTNVAEDLC